MLICEKWFFTDIITLLQLTKSTLGRKKTEMILTDVKLS